MNSLYRNVARSVFSALSALVVSSNLAAADAKAGTNQTLWSGQRLGYFEGISPDYFATTGGSRFQVAGRAIRESVGGVYGVGNDIFDIVTAPVQQPLLFGVAAAGTVALVYFDYELTTFYQDRVEPIFESVSLPRIIPTTDNPDNPFNHLAAEDQLMLFGMAGMYAYGFAFKDERAQVSTILASKALAYSYFTSHVLLKPVFGRYRPSVNLSSYPKGTTSSDMLPGFTANPFRWGEGSGVRFRAGGVGTAFPSYHFTQFFAVARVYSGVYDNSWIPYAVAGLASVSNIRGHRHWVSDMAAGAFLGTVIGQVVLNNYSERKSTAFSATPIVSSKGAGINLSVQF